jgi:hypothetical protein
LIEKIGEREREGGRAEREREREKVYKHAREVREGVV